MWRGIPSIDNKCTLYISQPQVRMKLNRINGININFAPYSKVRDTGPWKCSLVTEENELAESTFDVTVFTPAEVDFGARPFRSVMIPAPPQKKSEAVAPVLR